VRTVWVIAGSSSDGAAGVQADIQTLASLGVHPMTAITAVTAQTPNQVSSIESMANLRMQLEALETHPANAVKIGMLGELEVVKLVADFLKDKKISIVLDPVGIASSGGTLSKNEAWLSMQKLLFPLATVVTPNWSESEKILGRALKSDSDVVEAAKRVLDLGAQAVYIKGGDSGNPKALDYFENAEKAFWLSLTRLPLSRSHGTGCSFASATAAALAKGNSLEESVISAKSYVYKSLRTSSLWYGDSSLLNWRSEKYEPQDFPELTRKSEAKKYTFPKLKNASVGFYPIAHNAAWVEMLLENGVEMLQLRLKNLSDQALEEEIQCAVALAKHYDAQLFINDHWRLAIEYGAYGVHLGQEDLAKADLTEIEKAGLRLGISTHSKEELARAKSIQPSYYALGPIYPTQQKAMAFQPQGLEKIREWKSFLDRPLVAIGGISLERASDVWNAGADIIAVIGDLNQDEIPEVRVKKWLALFKNPSSQVVYQVEAFVPNSVVPEYEDWIHPHVQKLLSIQGFIKGEVYKNPDWANGKTLFQIRYTLHSRQDLENYFTNHASQLRSEALEKFGDKIQFQRNIFTLFKDPS